MRVATLKYLVPPLDAEVIALKRAMEAFSLDAGLPLSALLERFDSKKVKERQRRRLIMPVPSAPASRC